MLQQQRRGPSRSRSGGGEPETEVAQDSQTRLGNAEVAQRTGATDAGAALQDDEIGSWLTAGLDGAAQELSAETKVRGPEIDKSGQQPSRPGSVKGGMRGALISNKTEVELFSSADAKSAVAHKVPDGSACEVLSTSGDFLKVKVRSGTTSVEGWVATAVFSDQPALTNDDENRGLKDDFVYSKIEGDQSPVDPKGKDTAQGAIGDCYLIASMAAIANASPQTIKDMVKYNKEKGTYTVRFYEESGWGGSMKPVYIEVDGYVPTKASNRADPVYAGDETGAKWPAIIEKAYAKWKGGYDKIGDGGWGSQTMAEMTGNKSQSKKPSSMKEEEVVPFFENAKKQGLAIYAAVKNSQESATSTPFAGSGDGPYKATLSHTHRWNHIVPGTLRISDKQGKAGTVQDQGKEGDASSKLSGSKVDSGSIDYKSNAAELKFKSGNGPAKPDDLEVRFNYQGVVDVDKMLVANHAYAFEGVVNNGKELQFYNPWGTWQPKPITPGEFLKYFTDIATNQAPAGATKA